MKERFSQDLYIAPGCADAGGRLGYHDVFRLFMDVASIHAEQLGVGFEKMAERELFWLTAKTQVNFYERPAMNDMVTLSTWPEAPERVRANRSYEMQKNGKTVITGKTEWAVINTRTNRLAPMSNVFAEDMAFDIPTACPQAFDRIPDDYNEDEAYYEYIVRSIDIDVGGHMNNAAYVRAAIGSLSNAEIERLSPKRMCVIYKSPCFEGDKLRLYKREDGDRLYIGMYSNEETSVLISIEKGR